MSFQQHSSQGGRGYANSNLNTQQPSRQDIEMNGGPLGVIDSPGASRYVREGVDDIPGSAESLLPRQMGGHTSQAAPNRGVVTVREKSRTSCNLCTARKKRCDYIEINGQKQPCRLCKEKNKVCVFDKKPPRKTSGAPSSGSSKKAKRICSGGGGGNGALVIHRAHMGPSSATGLVGLEENMFVADFFERLGFFPIANERNIQRAIMEVLFRPSIEGAKRRGSDSNSALSDSERNGKPESETALSLTVRRADSPNLEGVLGGTVALRRRWELEGENKAFSCMLWCTIAIGAMTSNLRTTTVKQYVKLAEEAIDGLWSPDVATAKAYANMAMLYAFLDKEEQFDKHLSAAKELIQAMENDPRCEEVPLGLRDIVNELDRILALHYSDNMDVIKRCCYSADGEPVQMSPLLMCDSGLFHMVRFYTDGVFKAFWRDVLKRDPVLSETKKFSEKHHKECLSIEHIANTRPGLKDTGGALYIRAAMQFMRLPLKTDPREVLRSSIDLTKVICKVPGMIRLGPLKHYVHCLVMGLSRPAIAGMDEGAYEKLRAIYNSLDIAGPAIVGAEDMEIANLCKHPFCKGMAWSHQQKAIRQMKEAAAAAKAQAQAQAAGAGASACIAADGMSRVAPSMGSGDVREEMVAAAAAGVAPVVERRMSQQAESVSGHAAAASSFSASSPRSSASSPPPAAGGGVTGSVGGVVGMDRFSHPAGPTADVAQGISSFFCDPFSQQQHQQVHGGSSAAMPVGGMTAAAASAPFDGGADLFSKEERGPRPYSQGVGGVAPINGGQAIKRDHVFSAGSAWHQHQRNQQTHQQAQRQRRQDDAGSDNNGRGSSGLAAEKLMARHPRGGPSVSPFLSQPRRQYQQQQQQQQQQQTLSSSREGDAVLSMSMSMSSGSKESTASTSTSVQSASVQSSFIHSASAQSMPVRSASIQPASIQLAVPPVPAPAGGVMDDSERLEMPPDVLAYAQQQVRRQQAERERSANVRNLDELLLVNDDDRVEVPDMYEGDSDAGEFDSFMAGGVTDISPEQADESLSALAALLR